MQRIAENDLLVYSVICVLDLSYTNKHVEHKVYSFIIESMSSEWIVCVCVCVACLADEQKKRRSKRFLFNSEMHNGICGIFDTISHRM